MNGMGDFSSILDKLPAQFQQAASKVSDDDVKKNLRRTLGIIDSMTPLERCKPELIKRAARSASPPARVCPCRK